MPARDFDAIFYVKNPPNIRAEDGLFHIGYDIGKQVRFEIVMSAATFNKAMCLATEARARHQLGELGCSNVTRLRGKR